MEPLVYLYIVETDPVNDSLLVSPLYFVNKICFNKTFMYGLALDQYVQLYTTCV